MTGARPQTRILSGANSTAKVLVIEFTAAFVVHQLALDPIRRGEWDLGQTREWVSAHNRQLREELGLTAEQTAAIDKGE